MKYAILNIDNTAVISIQEGSAPYKTYKLYSQLTEGQKQVVLAENLELPQIRWYLFDGDTLIHASSKTGDDRQLQDNVLIHEGNENDPRIVAYELNLLKQQTLAQLDINYNNIKQDISLIYNNKTETRSLDDLIKLLDETLLNNFNRLNQYPQMYSNAIFQQLFTEVLPSFKLQNEQEPYNAITNQYIYQFRINGSYLPITQKQATYFNTFLNELRNGEKNLQRDKKIQINNATTKEEVNAIDISMSIQKTYDIAILMQALS